ncbi:DUF6359 domain-containing protein [Ferrimonas aestuarii]|uniref:Endonuclease YhcR N-terminal domain-containing protein n=1 Tax=Ferrimonas aestuarii TaxID=2569539 RepID=A0A4U1BP26_9GAMM|nr:DUF6359 domain-containing protein [Ferrimonas aestuarii]TKB54206.1 hypothetical protein FCL42_12480 [Ferrimonas aestuarii]
MKNYSLLPLVGLLVTAQAQAYGWNYPAPEKAPEAGQSNGKTVLFDVSHGGTEGNADWVIDGAFSDFADALVTQGYRVKEYRGVDLNGNGVIDYVDDLNQPNAQGNEAIITYSAIAEADVLVLAETNRPFTQTEYAALEQFVAAGKGIFFIADHYNADRNLNTWDATEVFNGYNRSALSQYNLGGAYGDLRNPQQANAGWLAQNFGIRFRFNGVDYKAGVSGVEPSNQTEGLTQGVEPILMAAGATLAIVDETKAKGLVYFSSSDTPTKWRHAVDSGIYLGGRAEGPYVAIAKSGAGKAAFIGDSSPIEDASPKYKRQDNGNSKKTYPGWTDPGHASVLAVNIINWLATPESYTEFGSVAHPAGEPTPSPMVAVEQDDPDNGQPWSQPSGSYNPWDSSTFAFGAYGASSGPGGDNGGDPSDPTPPTGTLSVTQALALGQGTEVRVSGVITAELNGEYALLLADSSDNSVTINVKLESQYRAEFSPVNNPELIGKTLIVSGRRDSYMSGPSIEYVNEMAIAQPYQSVNEVLSLEEGAKVDMVGVVSAPFNSVYAVELTDESGVGSINVQLPSAFRAQYSPNNNADIVGALIRVQGKKQRYANLPGVKSVTAIDTLSMTEPVDPAPGGVPEQALSITEARALPSGQQVLVYGVITEAVNDVYGLKLEDGNSELLIKLEADQRGEFSPKLNPQLLQQTLVVRGKRDNYMSQPSIEQVSEIYLVD